MNISTALRTIASGKKFPRIAIMIVCTLLLLTFHSFLRVEMELGHRHAEEKSHSVVFPPIHRQRMTLDTNHHHHDKDHILKWNAVLPKPTKESDSELMTSSSKFNYNTLALRNNSTLPDPIVHILDPDDNDHYIPVIVIVLSARENMDRRNIIRNTWGKDCILYFVIGGGSSGSGIPDATTSDHQQQQQLLLEHEQRQHHDLIDAIHPDSYASLPHKLKFALDWIDEHYYLVDSSKGDAVASSIGPDWVYKVDDDCYARVKNLYEQLLSHFNTGPSSWWKNQTDHHSSRRRRGRNIVIGKIQFDAPVYRAGKWKEGIEHYPHHTYPPFALGSCGYVLSRGIVQYIGQQYRHDYHHLLQNQLTTNDSTTPSMNHTTSRLFNYQGEDVSLGIWLEQSYLLYHEDMTLLIDSEYFSNDANCSIVDQFSIGHDFGTAALQECYDFDRRNRHGDRPPSEAFHDEQRHHVWRLRTTWGNDAALWGSVSRLQAEEAQHQRDDRAAQRSARRKRMQQQQQQ